MALTKQGVLAVTKGSGWPDGERIANVVRPEQYALMKSRGQVDTVNVCPPAAVTPQAAVVELLSLNSVQ